MDPNLMDTRSSYTAIPVDALLQKDEQIRVIAKDALLQFVALDYCTCGAFCNLQDSIRRQHTDLDEEKNIARCEPSMDPYDISEYIDKLDQHSDDGELADTYKDYVTYLALQEMWSYALAYPDTIYDIRNVQPVESCDGYSCTCDVMYSRVDKKHVHLSGATKQAIKMNISRQLADCQNPVSEEIIDLCARIALVVGNLPNDKNEEKVVESLFSRNQEMTQTDEPRCCDCNELLELVGLKLREEEVVGYENCEQKMRTVEIINSIENYLPWKNVREIAIGNFTFLNSLVNSWRRLFPKDPGQTQIFTMLYDKMTRLEDSLRVAKPSPTNICDNDYKFQHEVLQLTLKELEKWKNEQRMTELWNLSRDVSGCSTLTGLRSLNKIDLSCCPGNQPPVAKITANPTIINAGDTSYLDATESSDPDGTIIKYEFTQTAGTPGTIAHESPTNPRATFTAPYSVATQTNATITVTVTDDDSATSTNTVNITINPNPIIESAPGATTKKEQTSEQHKKERK